MTTVDLNADLGEGFGPWKMGDDAALLGIISSANVACGVHAGDWDVMARVMHDAVARGVRIGAHPGFPDLQGFGRREMAMAPDSAANLVRWQLGAAQAMARAAGGRVHHLKLHGALANMASRDEALALACFRGALSVDPALVLVVLAGTAQERAARQLGALAACEIFADRAYHRDGTLLDRRLQGAVIDDPEHAARRMLAMLEAGAILPENGPPIPTRIDTICLHGDTPGAIAMAQAVRAALEAEGVAIAAFAGEPLR